MTEIVPHEFIDRVQVRSGDFIDARIWDGVKKEKIENWLGGFSEIEEKLVMACLLERLVYRSEEQVVAMAIQLFQRVLPSLLVNTPFNMFRRSWIKSLSTYRKQDIREFPVRIVPIIRDYDPPTKSGPYLARFYKRRLGLNEGLMIWPWAMEKEIRNGVKLFICIDDFLGTGEQFVKFYRNQVSPHRVDDVIVVYVPLAAHERGIARVRQACPEIKIGSAEMLFQDKHDVISYWSGKLPGFLDVYNSCIDTYLPEISNDFKYGFGGLGVCYAFKDATPNCSVPFLWANSGLMRSLFTR